MKTIRLLLKNKVSTIVNLIGFTIGLSATFLILIWVDSETDFDSFNEDPETIYRVLSQGRTICPDGFPVSPGMLGELAKQKIPEISEQARIFVGPECIFYQGDNVIKSGYGLIADPEFFDIFNYKVLSGDKRTWLQDPKSIVLTRQLSDRIFGKDNPVGKVVRVNDEYFTVTGLIEDIPFKSHLKFDYVSPIANVEQIVSQWGNLAFNTYFRVSGNIDKEKISMLLTDIARDNNSPHVLQDSMVFKLQNMSDIYLNTPMKAGFPYLRNGDRKVVLTYLMVAFIIIAIATINYINFNLVNHDSRITEIGIKKALGATRFDLFTESLKETALQILVASVVAFIIAYILHPMVARYSGKEIEFNLGINMLKYIIPTIVFSFLLAGIYPSFYHSAKSSSYNAIPATGKFRTFLSFRSLMLLVQLIISGALILLSVFLFRQFSYIKNKDLGFNPGKVYSVKLHNPSQQNYRVIKELLLDNPMIDNVSCSDYLWATLNDRCSGCFRWPGKDPEYNPEMRKAAVGYDYFECLGVNIVEGRDFDRNFPSDHGNAFLVNETARNIIGKDDIIGKPFSQSGMRKMVQEGEIVGVFSDFNFKSLKNPFQPMVVRLMNDSLAAKDASVMYISSSAKRTDSLYSYVEEVWTNINGSIPLDMSLLSDTYSSQYADERRTYNMVLSFTIVAALISLMGMMSILYFINQKRKKEIGVRKVFGSDIRGILLRQVSYIFVICILSFIASIPLAVIYIRKILSVYSFRVSLDWYIFFFSILSIIMVIVGLGLLQTLKTSQINPAESLRYE